MLGLVIDTNRMTVSVPDDYIKSVCLLINSTWHTHRQRFTVKEAQELTGKLGHLAEAQTGSFTYLPTSMHPWHMPFPRTRDPWKTLLQSSKPLLSHYGWATSSAMLRIKSTTSHMPSKVLLNWCINPGASTTSPNQCTKRYSSSAKSYFPHQKFVGNPRSLM